MDEVTQQLEDEGLEKFETAWNDLFSGVARPRRPAETAGPPGLR